MNEEFARVFHNNPPARTTIEAKLAEPTMLVEIEAIAYIEPTDSDLITGGRLHRSVVRRLAFADD